MYGRIDGAELPYSAQMVIDGLSGIGDGKKRLSGRIFAEILADYGGGVLVEFDAEAIGGLARHDVDAAIGYIEIAQALSVGDTQTRVATEYEDVARKCEVRGQGYGLHTLQLFCRKVDYLLSLEMGAC